MALSAAAIFEINTSATASNVNAGYFNPANTGMATDGTVDTNTGNTNSPVFSSASYNFVTGDVGHKLYLKSGTNCFANTWYTIASVASNKATLTASIGSAETYVLNRCTPSTVAGISSVGTPTGITWAIDYSRTTASPFASTDLASLTGTTVPSTVTSVTNPFTIAMAGNGLHVTAGTNWTVGWYEIVSVSVITATLDRAVGTVATLTLGTGKVGGALSLGSADDAVFELAVNSTTTSTRYFIKTGTYTLGGAVSIAAAGSSSWPVIMEGYNTFRGDRPTTTNRPYFVCAGNAFTSGSSWENYSLQISGNAANMFTQNAGSSKSVDMKFINNSSTASRNALLTGTGGKCINIEAISSRGSGISAAASSVLENCYSHDSATGVNLTAAGISMINCLQANNYTSGINAATSTSAIIINNTIYGSEAKMGIGLNVANTALSIVSMNNIIYGCTTGAMGAGVSTSVYDNYNNFFNNTTNINDVTNYQTGPSTITLDPSFTSASQITGTAGKFDAGGSKLIDTTKNFTALGVVGATPAIQFLYIASGTGTTVSTYEILSISTTTNPNDTLNLGVSPGTNTTADKVYSIPVSNNFAVGTNMRAKGSPGLVPGSTTTGYIDIGVAQRQETGGSSSSSFTFS